MRITIRLIALLTLVLFPSLLVSQGGSPKLVDAHVHHNGDPEFLKKLIAKLDSVDGLALLITAPEDLGQVKDFIKQHPNRLICLGELRLDDPAAVSMVDRFHQAGCRGMGEITTPLRNFDDRSYWPIYERAEQYGMILLFHTGIVNRTHPEVPSDVSVERMRPTMLDTIARRFPRLTLIGAHLGNPDYAWAAEIARWNPNIYFDLSGSSLIKKQDDPTFWKSIFWWSSVVSPHTPAGGPHAFEKIVFGSDVFDGELEEFDRELERYRKMLDACEVPKEAQDNIFGGTIRRILSQEQ
ncbi:MAG: amidohydrolase family protein [Acidobacteria bacterium]|nr:amidohydrolase family protein [Acidobacteriota bacterium]